MTVNRLADRLRADADVVSVARLLRGRRTPTWPRCSTEIIADEHVPFLAASATRPPGCASARQWERTWDLQREEDATGKRLGHRRCRRSTAGADFREARRTGGTAASSTCRRSASSPTPAPARTATTRCCSAGPAGTTASRPRALIDADRGALDQDGWDADRLMPLLAGLAEVMPWVRQWHGESTRRSA